MAISLDFVERVANPAIISGGPHGNKLDKNRIQTGARVSIETVLAGPVGCTQFRRSMPHYMLH